MAICWMIGDLSAYFTHNLWGPILDRGDLVKMLPTLCLALIFKDILFHLTSKHSLNHCATNTLFTISVQRR